MWIDTEKWQEIFKTLNQHKLRTSLTGLGVFWGIFMLILLLGFTNAFENGVKSRFPAVANSIFIWIQGSTQLPYKGMPLGRQITLNDEDLALIQKNIPDIEMIRAQNSIGIWSGTPPYAVRNQKNGTFYVEGTHAGMEGIKSFVVNQGRSINEIDNRDRRKVALIGKRVLAQLFTENEDPIGADITLNGINFTVVGVFESYTAGNKQQDEEKIYLPNDTLRYSFNQMGWIGSIVIIPKEGTHASVVEQKVKDYLSLLKKVNPDDRGVFGSFNLQKEYDKIEGLFNGITFISWFVALGTILSGAIGVGNIMLIVVKERTREIGLRKALGATPGSIILMITQEAIFITFIAGYAGLVAGVGLLASVDRLRQMNGDTGFFGKPELDFNTALIALTVLMISGLIASFLPASKAASVNPIIALQDE